MLIKRLLARFLDGLAALLVWLVAGMVFWLTSLAADPLPNAFGGLLLLVVSLAALLGVVLLTWVNTIDLPAVRGQSIGKAKLAIEIDFSRSRSTSLHAASFIRELVYGVLGPLVVVSLPFTQGNRGLHDLAAGTFVRQAVAPRSHSQPAVIV